LAELVDIGFGGYLAVHLIVALVTPKSAPVKRSIADAEAKGLVIDTTNGRRVKTVAFITTGQVVLIALAPVTIVGRVERG